MWSGLTSAETELTFPGRRVGDLGHGAFADEHGNVTQIGPGCRLQAPAGWLHRTLAGSRARVVIGTDLPGEVWTTPINKDPADRPVSLST